MSIDLPENTFFIIDDVCIPHSWWTVEEGINDTLFFAFYDSGNPASYTATIPPGNYSGTTLADATNFAFYPSGLGTNLFVSYDMQFTISRCLETMS